MRKAGFSAEARAARDATYAAAADARAAAYAEAEQRHYDRLAAIQRYFGHLMARRGDPDADHALAFGETVTHPRRNLQGRQARRHWAETGPGRAAAGAAYPTTADDPG